MTLEPADSDWRGFAAAMRANRGDDTPRLVFCDWLDERYPRNHFSGFIRSCIELARMDSMHAFLSLPASPRSPFHVLQGPFPWQSDFPHWSSARRALAGSWEKWPCFADLGGAIRQRSTFHRGFPYLLVCPWEHWRKWASVLVAIGPIEEVMLTSPPPLSIEHDHRTIRLRWAGSEAGDMLRPEYIVDRASWDRGDTARVATANVVREKMLAELWPEDLVQTFSINTDW